MRFLKRSWKPQKTFTLLNNTAFMSLVNALRVRGDLGEDANDVRQQAKMQMRNLRKFYPKTKAKNLSQPHMP